MPRFATSHRLRLSASALLLTLLLAGCGPAATSHHDGGSAGAAGGGTDGQAAFLYSDATSALFIRWTRHGDLLDAVLDQAREGSDVTGGDQPVSGTQTGDTVTLTVGAGTWTGTLNGNQLVLHYPAQDGSLQELTLHTAVIDDYNAAVAALHQDATARANAAAAANAAAQADQAVTDADAALGRDLDAIGPDISDVASSSVFSDELTSMTNDLGQLRTDLATTASDAKSDCSTAGGDAGTVGGDLGTMGGDQGTLEGGIQTAEAAISSLTSAVSTARDDLAKLTAAIAADPSTPTTQHTGAQVDAAAGRVSGAIAAAHDAEAKARAQAKSLLATGQQLKDQADALAAHCSN